MSRPNLLLLFTDQQRHDTIAALGNPIIRTPALDRLVAEGTAFTSCYTPSPVCVSARCSLVTGQPAHRTGCDDNMPQPQDMPSFIESLSGAGYLAHGVGKMHFTPNPTRPWGFTSRAFSEEGAHPEDEFIAHLRANGYDHVHDPQGVRSDMYYLPQPSQLPARLHHTHWVADQSIDWLAAQPAGQPWFLFASFIKPHPPFENPTPWNKLYRAGEMPLPKRPPQYQELRTWQNRHQNRYKWRDHGIDDNLIRSMRAAYYSAISFIDYNVGRILDHLEQTGQLDNTLVLFTSDHGEHLGDYDCFGKRSYLDTAGRVPLLARWPGRLPAGERCEAVTSLLDVATTCCAAAGCRPPADNLPGEDLVKVASGESDRDMVVGQHQHDGLATYAAITRDWKYIHSVPDRKDFLFDRQADPDELRNCASNPLYQHVTAGMRRRLMDYFREDGYERPLDGNDWKQFAPPADFADDDAQLLLQDPPASIDLSGLPVGYQRPNGPRTL